MKKLAILLAVSIMLVSSTTYAEVHKLYYPSGQLKLEANFKDDKQEGTSKKYYESGQLQEESNFKDDKQEGIAKAYSPSGQLQAEANYKAGKLEGINKIYYKSGQLQGELNLKDGKPEGIVKTYYESGQLKEEAYFMNGAMISQKKYNSDGNLESEQDYLAAEGESYPSGEPLPQISPPARKKIDSSIEISNSDAPVDKKVYTLKTSKVFHRPECSAILGETDIMAFNSKAQALKVGGEPCLLCNP
jgi:hypothetical protein